MGEYECALIGLDGRINSVKSKTSMEDMEISNDVMGAIKGKMYFAYKEGLLVKLEEDLTLELITGWRIGDQVDLVATHISVNEIRELQK